MKKFKILGTIISAAMLCTALGGCGGTNLNHTADTRSDAAPSDTQAVSADSDAPENSDTAESAVYNFDMPVEGEKIAVITVKDFGEIKIKLFSEQASKGVENFVGLAEMNYYDELIFHRIIPHFMNQGGDPRGDGTGGKCIWGEKFDGGIPEGLYHFSGAVAYANSGATSTNGSQFYIVNTDEGEYSGDISAYPANIQELYKEKGGTPFLDGGYTVFGQVFEGMDVVRAMGQVETDENDKPLTQVMMESVRIVEYTAE